MNHDEPNFEKKLRKFSPVKECPKCGKLSLIYKDNLIYCTNCEYEEKITTVS